MKKFLTIISVLALIVVLALIFAASQANNIALRYKPDLEQKVSAAVGSPIKIGDLSTSILPRVRIAVDSIQIGSSAKDISPLIVENVMIDVALLPLLWGELRVNRLSVLRPELVFVRNGTLISLQGFPARAASSLDSQAPEKAPSPAGAVGEPTAVSLPPSFFSFTLNEFLLDQASIRVKDLKAQQEYVVNPLTVRTRLEFQDGKLTLRNLAVNARALNAIDLSMNGEEISYVLQSGVASLVKINLNTLNSTLTMKGELNSKTMKGSFSMHPAELDLSGLASLSSIVPALKTVSLSGKVHPSINLELASPHAYRVTGSIALHSVGVGASGITLDNLSGEIALNSNGQGQRVESKELQGRVGGQAVTMSFTAATSPDSAQLESFTVRGFGGTTELGGNLQTRSMAMSAHFSANQLDIGQVGSAFKPELAALVSGTLEHASGKIEGTLNENLRNNLRGEGSVKVRDGSLKGVNLAADILKGIKDLPFMQGSLISASPAEQQRELESNDTPIRALSASYRIADGQLSTSDFSLVSSLFSLAAQGTISFDMAIHLATQVTFDPGFSSGLATKVKELKGLQDAQGRMTLPVVLEGVPPKIVVLPDLTRILKLAGAQALKEKAGELLGKAFGGKDSKGGGKGLGGLLGF